MLGLRLLLVTGCLGAIALSLATPSWEAHLNYGTGTWIMHLGRHPVWDPPPAPDYRAFREHFAFDEDFPPENRGWGIHLHCDPFDVGLLALAYSWPIAFFCGSVYLLRRGSRRDLTLHCAYWAAVGTFLGIAGSILLWIVLGGWGPSALDFFSVLGFIAGICYGLATFALTAGNGRIKQTR